MPKDIKPFDDKKGTKYTVIPPFVSIEIKWDSKGKEYTYNVNEPKLTKDEQKTREKIVNGLLEMLDIELSSIKNRKEALNYLREQVKKILDEYDIKLPEKKLTKIIYYIYRDFVGLNDIEPMMQDPNIEDISCDGVNVHTYVSHKDYGTIKTDVMFTDEHELEDFVIRLSQKCGRFISYGEPLLDGSLSDGSRVQATFGAGVTIRGPTFDIRKFREIPFTPLDLYQVGTFSFEELAYMWVAIEKRKNILVSGGTASGKSTVLNAISLFIPENLKIVSIEDTAELNLLHENWVQSVSRSGLSAAGENKYGEVSMFDLLKASFRQRPDYVIVGEVRGKEATVMFQGMASGHAGLGTIHAESLAAVIERLSTPPINLPRSLIGILDILVIQVSTPNIRENSRRCKEIIEINPEKDRIGSKSVFRWDASRDETYFFPGSRILQENEDDAGEKEMDNRVKFLEMMNEKKVGFKEFPIWVHQYQEDPEKAFKLLSMS